MKINNIYDIIKISLDSLLINFSLSKLYFIYDINSWIFLFIKHNRRNNIYKPPKTQCCYPAAPSFLILMRTCKFCKSNQPPSLP